MPYGFLNFTTNQPVVANSNVAEAGTLSLEFDRLSQYTGNAKYRNLATKSVKAIFGAVDGFVCRCEMS